MIVLGIETSCDDTSIALVQDGHRVLACQTYTQTAEHLTFGGVVPEVASRAHLEKMEPLLQSTLDKAKMSLQDVDAVAFTRGPGLVGSLLVGSVFAKTLAAFLNKPLLPINHIHAHIYSALLDQAPELVFPSLALVASGGHTHLYNLPAPHQYQLLAFSSDDACGECFDKVAKMLELGYPGGPQIEQKAAQANMDAARSIPMPTIKHMDQDKRLKFSFSGLKTHMLHLVRKKQFSDEDLCFAFQETVFNHIGKVLEHAALSHPTQTIYVVGGVSNNQRFRASIQQRFTDSQIFFPLKKYCSDNAAMIASLGYFEYAAGPSSNPSLDNKKSERVHEKNPFGVFSRYPVRDYYLN